MREYHVVFHSSPFKSSKSSPQSILFNFIYPSCAPHYLARLGHRNPIQHHSASMRAQAVLAVFLTLAPAISSSQSGSWESLPFELRGLEQRGQILFNPCPEFSKLPKQKCSDPLCGGDSIRGICNLVRPNGEPGPMCLSDGGVGACGPKCLCVPKIDPRYAQVAPVNPVQVIFTRCPVPNQKCWEPQCGRDNGRGYCKKKLVNGAQP